tara:strand:+ start:7072 stop:7308 length:237 start_codon:yes stop_codon:yes gene_type:complete
MKIPLDAQVQALEEAVIAHRSYVRTVKRLVTLKERPKEILEDTERRLPLMEAALKTLKWVQLNRETIIEAHNKCRNGT